VTTDPIRPSRETRKRLDAALNEILQYACDHLEPGWEIQIRMLGHEGGGEAQIELLDPDCKDVAANWDGDSLNVWDMAEHSREPETETRDA